MIPFLLMRPVLIDQIEQVTVGPLLKVAIVAGVKERQHPRSDRTTACLPPQITQPAAGQNYVKTGRNQLSMAHFILSGKVIL